MAPNSKVRHVLAWVGVVLWCLAPVCASALLTSRSDQASFTTPVPVNDLVRANEGDTARDVKLVLSWHAPNSLVAPEWSGVIQAVWELDSPTISSGTVIARIEEVDRLACASRYPMSRSVAKGNKGGDVATLQECLKIFGYDTSKDKGVYGQATQAAVATLAAKTGADSQKGLYFEAGWLVFLPEDNYQVDQIDLVVGTPAPPAGAVIAQASLALTRARLADSNWLTAETSSLEDPTSGKSGQDAPIDQPVTADLDESLHVTNQIIELEESRDEVSSTALAGLQALLPAGTSSIEARLVRPAGTSELMVSAAAIVTTPQGAVCVLKVSQDSLVPVAVEVIGDWNGNAIITGQLQLGDEVRVAPAAEDRRCASN